MTTDELLAKKDEEIMKLNQKNNELKRFFTSPQTLQKYSTLMKHIDSLREEVKQLTYDKLVVEEKLKTAEDPVVMRMKLYRSGNESIVINKPVPKYGSLR